MPNAALYNIPRSPICLRRAPPESAASLALSHCAPTDSLTRDSTQAQLRSLRGFRRRSLRRSSATVYGGSLR